MCQVFSADTGKAGKTFQPPQRSRQQEKGPSLLSLFIPTPRIELGSLTSGAIHLSGLHLPIPKKNLRTDRKE